MARRNKEKESIASYQTNLDDVIKTHIKPFDMHADGGVLRGDMIEIAGDTGTGKSTLITEACAHICGQGYKVMYLDFERGQKTTEKSIIANVGLLPYIENGQFILRRDLITYTHLEEAYTYAFENDIDFVIIDSMTAVISTSMLEGNIEKAVIGVDARLQTNFVRKYKALGAMNGVTTIFISQVRTSIGIGFGEKTEIVSAGAKALGFYCDLRFYLERGPKLTRPEVTGVRGLEEVVYGNKARLFTIKNRSNRPAIKLPCPIVFGKGMSAPYFYYEILEANSYIKTSGAWKAIEELDIKENGEIKLIIAIAKKKQEVHDFLESRGHFELIIPEDFFESDEVVEADSAEEIFSESETKLESEVVLEEIKTELPF